MLNAVAPQTECIHERLGLIDVIEKEGDRRLMNAMHLQKDLLDYFVD